MTNSELDEDSPLWLVNEQIKGLLEGDGADEDHESVLAFLRSTGLPEDTVRRMHRALINGEVEPWYAPSAMAASAAALDAASMKVFCEGQPSFVFGEWKAWRTACLAAGMILPPSEFKGGA